MPDDPDQRSPSAAGRMSARTRYVGFAVLYLVFAFFAVLTASWVVLGLLVFLAVVAILRAIVTS